MVLKFIDTETNKEQIIDSEKLRQLYNQSPEDFMKYIDFSSYLLNSMLPVIHNDKLDLLIDTFITGGNSAKNGFFLESDFFDSVSSPGDWDLSSFGDSNGLLNFDSVSGLGEPPVTEFLDFGRGDEDLLKSDSVFELERE